ncbi:MAG: (Fe-S)-binding protein [Chloroflexota bacterium]
MDKAFVCEIGGWVAAQLEACTRCGICAEACPFYKATGNPEYTPIWKLELLRRAYEQNFTLTGKLKRTVGLAKPITQADLLHWRDLNYAACSTCNKCSMACPMGITIGLLMHPMRNGLARAGAAPDSLIQIQAAIAQTDNIFGYPVYERTGWVEYMPDAPDDLYVREQAEVVYFVGCVSTFSPTAQRIAEALVRVLSAAEVNFTLLGEKEACCGFPLKAAGLSKAAEALVQKNVEAVTATGAHTIVFNCPACRLTWLREYAPRLPQIRPLHSTEFLAELIRAGKLKLNPLENSVTYHDPCDLARNGGVYDAPREVLQAIPALTLHEVAERRASGLCCGGGGNVEAVAPDHVNRVAADTVKKLTAAGAQILATACPQCMRAFERVIKEDKYNVTVLDVAEIVARSVGDG